MKTIGAGALLASVGSGIAAGHGGALPRQLAEVRSATAMYNDPATAYADGYMAIDAVTEDPILEYDRAYIVEHGEFVPGMGIHFANFGLVGTVVDPLQPQVLAYGVSNGGGLVLGAVEYIIPTDAVPDAEEWFHGDDDEWEPFFIPGTSALHVWVHSHNPEGVFHHTNSRKLFNE